MNGQWIRKIADEQGIDALYARTEGFWPESAAPYPDTYKKKVLSIIYDRLKTLSDLRDMTDYFFKDPRILLPAIVTHKMLKKMSEEQLIDLLTAAIEKLDAIPENEWNADNLQNAFNELLKETKKKPGEFFTLIRIAVSFAPFSPALNLTAEALGKEVFLARLNKVRTALAND